LNPPASPRLSQPAGTRGPQNRSRSPDRAATGLSAVFLRLQTKVNWHRLFEELIAGFDRAALERRQTEALTRHQVPLPS
jgi:hypothetical protein